MLRLLPWLVVCVSLAGCGDPDAGALFADITYAVECRATGGCEPQLDRDICGINQGDPCPEVGGAPTLSCNVIESADTRMVSFSGSQDASFSISVRNMVVPFAGGSAGGAACTVTIVERPNRYVGDCGSGAPTDVQPCQITNVRFYDDGGNPTVSGDIFCEQLENQASPLLEIELHEQGASTTARTMPGHFRVANCVGLDVPAG